MKNKEGDRSFKVANLSEFWKGQKHIVLMDPNLLACKDWKELLQQLIDSKAKVDFNQGLDIRMMTEEKAEMISKISVDSIHFAWDRIEDKDLIIPKFESFRQKTTIRQKDLQVYVLCGDREKRILEGDLFRINWLKKNGFAPFVMLYDKQNIPRGNKLRDLQRYVNNRFIFWSCDSFEEYLKRKESL